MQGVLLGSKKSSDFLGEYIRELLPGKVKGQDGTVKWIQVKSRQVKLGQVKSRQVKSVQVTLGEF